MEKPKKLNRKIIRKKLAERGYTMKRISNEYGIGYETVRQAANNAGKTRIPPVAGTKIYQAFKAFEEILKFTIYKTE